MRKTQKKYSYRRAFIWLCIYLVLCIIPMMIALSKAVPTYRTFWIEFGVALGFLGFAMLALQLLFSGRIVQIAPSFGMDNILQFHKYMGIIGFLFVLAHPVTLILANIEFLSYFDPRVNFLRAVALSFASISLVLIISTSIWRINFGLNYEKWRLVHGFLALALVFIGVVHSIQVGHYLDSLWKKILLSLVMGGSMYLVIHTRLVRPWLNRKKPYRVTKVKPERDDSYTLKIKADGHPRMQFKPGQFAWLTINDSPFSLQQHPFSIASGELEEELSFTAKASGDFTGTWKDIEPGQKVFLEGPFGSFTMVPGKNVFLVMGGIGITPAMSMLRTMRQKKGKPKAILIYGNNDWENITFREELEELEKEIDLKVVHILMEPGPDWEGEKGVVSKELLEKYMPDEPLDYLYYICGPKPLMDITEVSLRELNIDWRHIYTERFEIV